MTKKEQLEQRKKLVDDAIRLKKMVRVPHISNFALWPILDYGAKLYEACTDWNLQEKVQRHFHETYKFDCSGQLGAFLCNPAGMLKGIGEGFNIFNDEAGTLSIRDVQIMGAEDYDEFVKDMPGLIWNKLFPRKFPRWGELTVGDYRNAIDEFVRYSDYMARIGKICVEEYGLPSLSGNAAPMCGIEKLFNSFRGMRGLAADMRKQPERLLDAVRYLDSTDEELDAIFQKNIQQGTCVVGIRFSLLSHTLLSTSQWDRYMWPFLQRVISAAVRADSTVNLFSEGTISRFYDYWKEVPPGRLALHIEQDDIFEVKKNLPNVCLIGGMTTAMLGSASKETCVSYAKHLCDELGKEGGFILSQDKMMSYMRDAKPENIKAVCDFAADYGL